MLRICWGKGSRFCHVESALRLANSSTNTTLMPECSWSAGQGLGDTDEAPRCGGEKQDPWAVAALAAPCSGRLSHHQQWAGQIVCNAAANLASILTQLGTKEGFKCCQTGCCTTFYSQGQHVYRAFIAKGLSWIDFIEDIPNSIIAAKGCQVWWLCFQRQLYLLLGHYVNHRQPERLVPHPLAHVLDASSLPQHL